MPRTRLVGRFALLTAAALCTLSLSAAAAEARPGQWFDRVLIVVLENQNYNKVVKHDFMKKLAESGTLLVDYQALTHPSYGNYLGMVAGSDFAVGGNKQQDLDATSIADLLEQKGLSWKQYAEGFPGNCFKGDRAGTYFRKHAPFVSFKAIQNDARRCANLLPATAFDPNRLPNYALYIPDANNSGHDTGLDFAADWLEKFLTPLIGDQKFMQRTLVVVTFDESKAEGHNYICTVLLGSNVKANHRAIESYTHYDLLRTIEDNFALGTLGREDAKARAIEGVWLGDTGNQAQKQVSAR